MKKIFSSILISFILFTNLIFPISVFSASTWSYLVTYKTNRVESPNDNFTSLEACNTERTALMNSAEYKNNPNVYNVPSECVEKKDLVIPVTPKTNVATNNSIYTMLAPIGGITRMDSSGTDPTCAADPQCVTNDIGKYLNIIFKLAIGICAALAVIMLIINGIKYMGDESVFGKTEAKKNMFGAIVGLLIALGAWALLNTINPALTGQGGLNISSANIEIEEPPMVVESTGIPTLGVPLGTSGTQNYCPDGRDGVVVGNKTIMNTCKTISSKITKLINDALAQNIKLSGASFRSYADQKQARITNKCPDVLTSPPESCKPPTAIPGTSMHEGGLAIDFQCNGQIIKTTDNECFLWLTKNAQSAGLKNYAKEPWHWSTNGK